VQYILWYMKILQLNIWGGKLGKQIIELIHTENPDIVCFQEVVALPHQSSLLFTTYGDIVSQTGYEYSYFSAAFGFTMMNYLEMLL
jgi:exonuclease III